MGSYSVCSLSERNKRNGNNQNNIEIGNRTIFLLSLPMPLLSYTHNMPLMLFFFNVSNWFYRYEGIYVKNGGINVHFSRIFGRQCIRG